MGRTAILSAALIVVVSCGKSPTLPTAPSPPTQPTSGITLGEITPGSGATLAFRPCGSGFGLCTDQMQTAFDVVAAYSFDATVVVTLARGSIPCVAAYFPATLTGGTSMPFKTSSFAAVYDEEGQLLCSMPVETTRLVVEVFGRNSPAQPVLTRELPYHYTLTVQ